MTNKEPREARAGLVPVLASDSEGPTNHVLYCAIAHSGPTAFFRRGFRVRHGKVDDSSISGSSAGMITTWRFCFWVADAKRQSYAKGSSKSG